MPHFGQLPGSSFITSGCMGQVYCFCCCAMLRGQANGTVCADVDARAAAAFVISSIEGCVGMAKASQSREFLGAGFHGLIEYLEHLRPQSHRAG